MCWKSLPVEGAVLDELRVYGNSKDCEVLLRAREPDYTLRFPASCPKFEIEILAKVRSEVFTGDDNCLGVRYIPVETVHLEVCQIACDGDQFAVEFKETRDPGVFTLSWMVRNFRLRLVAAE